MIHPGDNTNYSLIKNQISKLPMNLIKDEVAHDGHPGKACQEEVDIAVTHEDT